MLSDAGEPTGFWGRRLREPIAVVARWETSPVRPRRLCP